MPEEATMVSRTDLERRDRLAYHALYYAIQGDEKRSEKIRHLVRQMENQGQNTETAVSESIGV